MNSEDSSRRRFLKASGATGLALATGMAGVLRSRRAPAVIAADSTRPQQSWGLQIGDVTGDRAVIWSRTDRPAQLIVEWSREASFEHSTRVVGPLALESADFTARVDLSGLPTDTGLFIRTHFETADTTRAGSEPVTGQFRTPPARPRDLRFLWGGDVVGQGWGIDPARGGMKAFEAMRQARPDFFIHSGDTIYADVPLAPAVKDASGSTIWNNAYLEEVPEKLQVAQTQREFHRAQLYNRYDANLRGFSAEVPQIWQWDDHEVANNWSDSKVLDAQYTERRIRTLAAYSARAFIDYSPMRPHAPDDAERIYRVIPYGPDLDVFVLDMRSYRGANSYNRQPVAGPDTAFLGSTQVAWLKRALHDSRATWKAIAADMPLGLLVADGTDAQGRPQFEAVANGDGPALGRELEIADLLRFIKRAGIVNTVWLTADVHYCAAHYYHPEQAVFQDFEPFWEFVSGPLHAGPFGPNTLDNTFGPRLVFQKCPPTPNLPPDHAEYQFFGQIDIDARSKEMVVALKDANGATVFSQRIAARPLRRAGV